MASSCREGWHEAGCQCGSLLMTCWLSHESFLSVCVSQSGFYFVPSCPQNVQLKDIVAMSGSLNSSIAASSCCLDNDVVNLMVCCADVLAETLLGLMSHCVACGPSYAMPMWHHMALSHGLDLKHVI